jgi:hypothetical protein
MIAVWYTGDQDSWRHYLTYNGGLRVHDLQPGDIVRIPEKYVTRENPMPKSFSKKFPSRIKPHPGFSESEFLRENSSQSVSTDKKASCRGSR